MEFDEEAFAAQYRAQGGAERKPGDPQISALIDPANAFASSFLGDTFSAAQGQARCAHRLRRRRTKAT